MELSFPLDSQLTKALKAIDQKAHQRVVLLDGLPEPDRRAIHTQARITTIGATTRIENAVLTNAQIAWIDTELATDGRPTSFSSMRTQIQAKVARDRERSLEEVAGCREMLAIIYAQGATLIPLTQATLCGLHRELPKYYPPAAPYLGRYKMVPNSVIERDETSGAERIVLETSPPGPLTESAVSDMLNWYNQIIADHPWPVAVGCEFVFRFLAAHPFQDGNGRLGRALFLLALLQCGDHNLNRLAPYLAIDRFIEQNKTEYYAVLARVSGGRFHLDPQRYDIRLFLDFKLKAVDAALDAIILYRERIERIRGLSEPASVVFRCFNELPEQRLTPRRIRQETGIPERTVSRALRDLCESGLIQRYGKGAGTRYQLVF
ncbi:MAG: Fic family protein [Thermoanaerobaculales bacterium]|nr:Fic family protein [Thermoanaerobaculales bacterium]